MSDAERRGWLARLPDQCVVEPPSDPLLQRYLAAELDTTEAKGEGEALGSALTSLPLGPADIAAIGARIALGHTKTAIVRAMPGYETRRQREFAAYYDRITSDLAAQAIVARRVRDVALAGQSDA